jgi:molybdate transport system ATP-binding protein
VSAETLAVRLRRRAPFPIDVEFATPARGVTALFGPSGCGKTTVVDMIAGARAVDSGRVAVAGRILYDSERGLSLPVRERRIGYVFQEARLFPHLSVHGNLLYGWRRTGRLASGQEIDHVIEVLGIGELLHRRPAKLSGGERQRVALGRALLTSPALLLMDEPLAAVDSGRKEEILPYLERLRDELGMPTVYVTHSVDEVARLADHLVVMDAGRVAAVGPVAEIMGRSDLHPLTGRYEAGGIVNARVLGQDIEYGLTVLGFAGGELRVPTLAYAEGTAVRVRIRARDVILARTHPDTLGASNILAGVVHRLRVEAATFAEVEVDLGGNMLLVRMTRLSVDKLGLAEGQAVWAVIKSVAIERRSIATRRANETPASPAL